MKTLARIHPKHRSRYSHTAYIHSTSPDPVQNRMIDRCVAITNLVPRAFPLKVGGTGGKSPGNEVVAITFRTGMNITNLVYLQDKETMLH